MPHSDKPEPKTDRQTILGTFRAQIGLEISGHAFILSHSFHVMRKAIDVAIFAIDGRKVKQRAGATSLRIKQGAQKCRRTEKESLPFCRARSRT